jgi:hypothetical protein
MAIIDGLDDQRGIQTLGTQIANASAESQHFSDVLHHTNGYLYCVVCQAYSNTVNQRRLYVYRSTDSGDSWTLITNLTTGNFDTNPTLFQLDTSDTGSDIGIIFLRHSSSGSETGVITRMSIDVSGTQTLAPDAITGNPTASLPVCCVPVAGGFKLFFSNGRFSNGVSVYSNTSFSLNTWTAEAGINILGANNQGHVRRVRQLSNGDHLMVVCYRTGLSGSTSGDNSLPDNLRTDLGALTSTDDGVSWNTVQNLTSYAGTAGFSEDGILSALNGDFVELADGRIAFMFQEGYSYLALSGSTTPSISTTDAFTRVLLHPVHGYLIYANVGGTDGGVYVHNLGTNTITRIHTGSTPALWENEVMDIALSSDGKYLAVATYQTSGGDSGSLEVLDTTDATVTNWTVTSIRTTTSPALLAIGVRTVVFDPGTYDLYFTYANTPGSSIYGGKIDASDIPNGIVDLAAPASIGTNIIVPGLYIGSSHIFGQATGTTSVFSTVKSTGAAGYSLAVTGLTATSAQKRSIFGVGSNIAVVGTSGIFILSDNGSALTLVSTPSSGAGDPSWGSSTSRSGQMSSSDNVLISGQINEGWKLYCASSGVYYPQIWCVQDYNFGFNSGNLTALHFDEIELNGKVWLAAPGADQVYFSHLNTGRLRYGLFTYNTGTSQVVTAGANFYDAVNEVRVVDDWNKLIYPRITRTDADKLVISCTRFHVNRTSKPKSVVIGVIEADAQRFQMRARIQNTYTQTLQMRARIQNTSTQTIDVLARIVFAQCITMRARIAPRNTQTIEMRASIQGAKESKVVGSFSISGARAYKVVGRFSIGGGYNTAQTLAIGASIVKSRRSMVNGHFIVTRSSTAKVQTFANAIQQYMNQSVRIGAGITRP